MDDAQGGHVRHAGARETRRSHRHRRDPSPCLWRPRLAPWPAVWSPTAWSRRIAHFRLLRDNVVIYTGELESLKRMKDDVQGSQRRLRVWYQAQELQRHQGRRCFSSSSKIKEIARTLRCYRRAMPKPRNPPRSTAASKSNDQIQRDLTELDRARVERPARGHGHAASGGGYTRLTATPRCFSARLPATRRPPQDALNQAAGFLRNGLFKRLHIHTGPTLHFAFRPHDRACGRHERLDCQGGSVRAKEGIGMTAPHVCGCSGAPCMGWCCSTNPLDSPATKPCKRSSGCCVRKWLHRHA